MRRRVVVRGLVQGVWFRASAEREAAARGVSGFARNQRDGSVLLELEGDAAAVDSMVAWCRAGPPRADVTGVEVTELPPQGTRGFRTGLGDGDERRRDREAGEVDGRRSGISTRTPTSDAGPEQGDGGGRRVGGHLGVERASARRPRPAGRGARTWRPPAT